MVSTVNSYNNPFSSIADLWRNRMFVVAEFYKVTEATEHIKKILAELETPEDLEYQVIHSISETECCEDGGTWEVAAKTILDYLRDLDAQQGYMIYEENHWDFVEWDEPDEKPNIFKPEDDQVFISAGEGVIVLYNKFALCENQYPIIVIKKSIWKAIGERLFDLLKHTEIGADYTSKISPALYVELFYVEK